MTNAGDAPRPSASGIETVTADGEKLDVRIDWAAEPAPVYSDFATVGNRGLGDFAILFCCLSQEPAERDSAGKYVARARPVASVKMNAQIFFALLQALTDNWNKWARGVDPRNPIFELKAPKPEEANAKSK